MYTISHSSIFDTKVILKFLKLGRSERRQISVHILSFSHDILGFSGNLASMLMPPVIKKRTAVLSRVPRNSKNFRQRVKAKSRRSFSNSERQILM